MQNILVVEFSAIFNEKPKDLKTYLSGIGRSKFLEIMSFFLGFDNTASIYKDLNELLQVLFSPENRFFAKEIFLKLQQLSIKFQKKLQIINPVCCLELFEFGFNNLDENNSQSSAEAEINIFKAILFQNEEYSKLENRINMSPDAPAELQGAMLLLAQSFGYSELINYNLNNILMAQIIKSILMFEFLEGTPEAKILLSEFLKRFNCKDWKTYIT